MPERRRGTASLPPLAHRHGDALGRAALGQQHLEDAAPEARLDAVGGHQAGQLEPAPEGPPAPLEPHEAVLGGAAHARELERATVGLQRDVGAADARQLGVEQIGVRRLEQVEDRAPDGRRPRAAHLAPAHERLLEELAEPLLEARQLGPRKGGSPGHAVTSIPLPQFFPSSTSTYSASITSSPCSPPLGAPPACAPPPAPAPCADCARYMASASLCEACSSRSRAVSMAWESSPSRARLASAIAVSSAARSSGPTLSLFSSRVFSVL